MFANTTLCETLEILSQITKSHYVIFGKFFKTSPISSGIGISPVKQLTDLIFKILFERCAHNLICPWCFKARPLGVTETIENFALILVLIIIKLKDGVRGHTTSTCRWVPIMPLLDKHFLNKLNIGMIRITITCKKMGN